MFELKFKNKSVEQLFKRVVEELEPLTPACSVFIRTVASTYEAKVLSEDDNATDFTINAKDIRLAYQVAKNEKAIK